MHSASPKADEPVIPQYGLPKILLMYAWPVVWFTFLIYVVFDDAFRERLISAFFDRYYPDQGQDPDPQTIEMSPERLEHYAGSYRWVRYPRSTVGKLIALVPGPYSIRIEANHDTSLSLSFFGAEAAWRYVPVG